MFLHYKNLIIIRDEYDNDNDNVRGERGGLSQRLKPKEKEREKRQSPSLLILSFSSYIFITNRAVLVGKKVKERSKSRLYLYEVIH